MTVNEQKLVDFHKYCPLCVHSDKAESEDPCWMCLTFPTHLNSRKPVNYVEKVTTKKSKKVEENQNET